MDLINPEWLKYGPWGILVIFIIFAYQIWKEIRKGEDKRAAFTEKLAEGAGQMMKEAFDRNLDVQTNATEAMLELKNELVRRREESERQHKAIVSSQKEVYNALVELNARSEQFIIAQRQGS